MMFQSFVLVMKTVHATTDAGEGKPWAVALKGPSPGLVILSWQTHCIHCVLAIVSAKNHITMQPCKAPKFQTECWFLSSHGTGQKCASETQTTDCPFRMWHSGCLLLEGYCQLWAQWRTLRLRFFFCLFVASSCGISAWWSMSYWQWLASP